MAGRLTLAGILLFIMLFAAGCMLAQPGKPGVSESGSRLGFQEPEGSEVRCYPLPPENLKTCYIFKDGTLVDEKITSGSF